LPAQNFAFVIRKLTPFRPMRSLQSQFVVQEVEHATVFRFYSIAETAAPKLHNPTVTHLQVTSVWGPGEPSKGKAPLAGPDGPEQYRWQVPHRTCWNASTLGYLTLQKPIHDVFIDRIGKLKEIEEHE
jgi:hypothetical protein